MKKGKIIISDWGGVVESHHGVYSVFQASIDFIKLYTNKYSDEEILTIFNKCSINRNGKDIGELGTINDIYEWIDRINDNFKINVSYGKFLEDYRRTHDLIYSYQDVVKFIKSVKSKCKIAILSNLMLIDKERIDKQMALSDFDYVFLSFEMGLIKPDEKIYEKVEKLSGFKPDDILLIDDTKENIEVAKKRGWNTCQATGKDLELIKESVNNFLKS